MICKSLLMNILRKCQDFHCISISAGYFVGFLVSKLKLGMENWFYDLGFLFSLSFQLELDVLPLIPSSPWAKQYVMCDSSGLDKGLIWDGASSEEKWWTSESWFSAETPAAAVAPGMEGSWFGEHLCCSLNHPCCSSQCLGSLFDVPVQAELSWMWSDRTAAQGSTAEESDVFFANEKLCKASIFKNRKTNKLKAVGWLRGKERSLVWHIKHHSAERISVFQPKVIVFLLIRLIGKSVNNSLFFLKIPFFPGIFCRLGVGTSFHDLRAAGFSL